MWVIFFSFDFIFFLKKLNTLNSVNALFVGAIKHLLIVSASLKEKNYFSWKFGIYRKYALPDYNIVIWIYLLWSKILLLHFSSFRMQLFIVYLWYVPFANEINSPYLIQINIEFLSILFLKHKLAWNTLTQKPTFLLRTKPSLHSLASLWTHNPFLQAQYYMHTQRYSHAYIHEPCCFTMGLGSGSGIWIMRWPLQFFTPWSLCFNSHFSSLRKLFLFPWLGRP